MDSREFMDWWRSQPRAPCEDAVGVRLEDCDRQRNWVWLSFEVGPGFTNARGTVQGGFVAALLDTCLGIPVLLASDLKYGPITLNLSVDYQAAVLPGRISGEGQVTRIGRSVAFVSGRLFDENGTTLVQGRQVAQLFERPV